MNNNIFYIIDEIKNSLICMAAKGKKGFEFSQKSLDIINSWGKADTGSTNASKGETMGSVKAEISGCSRCRLAKTRKNIVFGEGSLNAKLMFIGEGPGYEENRTGRPFVGQAGMLLTKIIKAIDLTRDEVYISNIVKCNPPGNRNPLPEEIDACLPFLQRQINVIKPKFICALGAVAAQTLLNSNQGITALRHKFYDFNGSKLIATYHPAYLLRNPDKKRDVWEDMKMLIKELK